MTAEGLLHNPLEKTAMVRMTSSVMRTQSTSQVFICIYLDWLLFSLHAEMQCSCGEGSVRLGLTLVRMVCDLRCIVSGSV